MHALIDESLHISDRFKQFPQFSQEAECHHIEGAMQDPAEPPSAADAEPPEAPDVEPRRARTGVFGSSRSSRSSGGCLLG